MSRHVGGSGPAPWAWGDVPLAWQDWVLVSLGVHNILNSSATPE